MEKTNFFDLLNTVYTKKKLTVTDDIGLLIALTNTLIKNENNLKAIREVIDYQFYIPPKHYFYLLYFFIPKVQFVPKSMKLEIDKGKKEEVLLSKIKHVLGWSNREIRYNQGILEKTVLNNKKYWKEQLGVRDEQSKKV